MANDQFNLPRFNPLQAGLLLAGLACFAYFPSISGNFILDDDLYLTDCRFISAPGGLIAFWFTSKPIDYYPVSNTSLWIEWRLWGMHPTGYHVTNLLLHIASALLVWAVLRKLSIPGAYLAGLLYAVHPVNVESVAWISQRKDMMAVAFSLVSILWYLKADDLDVTSDGNRPSSNEKWYWRSLLAFVLAMFSKGSVATLPLILLILAWWKRGRVTKSDVLQSAPFFVVAVVMVGVNIWYQSLSSGEVIRKATFAERLAGAAATEWFYLSKAILPIDLVFVYPQWRIQIGTLLWWLPLLTAVLVTGLLFYRGHLQRTSYCRSLLFAWIFFGVTLLPVMGFTDVGFMKHSLVADHYQHVAMIAVIALAAAAWDTWRRNTAMAARPATTAVAIAVTAALTLLTWQQNRLYGDPITLYRATLEKNPDSWMIRNNLGGELNTVNRPEEALVQCQEALRLKPDFAEAFYNFATSLKQLGRLEESVPNYQEALRLKPDFPDAFNSFGIVLGRLGRYPEAIEQFRRALALDPTYVDPHSNIALALLMMGRNQEAIDEFDATLRLKPDHVEAHSGLAQALAREGRFPEAVEHFELALKFKPQFTDALAKLAETYAQMKQPGEAIATAQRAIGLARSQGDTASQNRIQAWLDSYLSEQAKTRDAGPPSRSAPK